MASNVPELTPGRQAALFVVERMRDAQQARDVDEFKNLVAATDPKVREIVLREVIDSAMEAAAHEPGANYRDPHTRQAVTDTALKAFGLRPLGESEQ